RSRHCRRASGPFLARLRAERRRHSEQRRCPFARYRPPSRPTKPQASSPPTAQSRRSPGWTLGLPLRLRSLPPPPSLSRARRQKALEPEVLDRRRDNVIEDQPRHGVGRHRREQDAVAVVPGRIEQAGERTGSEDRRIVETAGPVYDPDL